MMILRDGTVLDGDGHRIVGNLLSNPRGILIYYCNNVKVINLIILGIDQE